MQTESDTGNDGPSPDHGGNLNKKIYVVSRQKYLAEVLGLVLSRPPCSIVPVVDAEEATKSYEKSPGHVFIILDYPDEAARVAEKITGWDRGCATVIFTFSSLECFMRQVKEKALFPELGVCLKKEIVFHTRLPCEPEELKALYEKLRAIDRKSVNPSWRHDVDKEKGTTIQRIADRLASKQDADQRHGMGNLTAAARILNGAIRSGDYDLCNPDVEAKAMCAYEELIENNRSQEEKELKLAEALDTIAESKNRLFQERKSITHRRRTVEPWHRNLKKVLVIDDQIAMWKPVWEFILGSGKVHIVEDSDQGLEYIRQTDGDLDCVVLDLDLGEGKPNGLQVLPLIKYFRFDLPVVVMTAYDHNPIANKSYRLGATYCFVKERRERKDRDSVDYFKMLKKLLTSLLPFESEQRRICRRFQKIEHFLDRHGPPESGDELRKAIFFLLLDLDEIRAERFLIGDRKEEWRRFQLICHSAYKSVELFIESLLSSKEIVFKPTENLRHKFEALVGFLGQAKPENLHEMPNVLNLFHGSGHEPRSEHIALYTHKTTLHLLQEVIEWFKSYFHGFPSLSVPLAPSHETTLPLAEYQHPADQGQSSHEGRGRIGALRLLQGAFLQQHEKDHFEKADLTADFSVDDLLDAYDGQGRTLIQDTKPAYACLFVDDNGIDSGWKRVLDLLFPETYVDYFEFTKDTRNEEVLTAAKSVDFVILDLRLPGPNGDLSEEVGLELLKIVKRELDYVPMIVITATDDAYFFKKSMSVGAFDCLPKTNECFFRVDDIRYFSTYLDRFKDAKQQLMRHLQQVRPISYQIEEIESFNRFMSLCYVRGNSLLGSHLRSKKQVWPARVIETVGSILRRSYFFLSVDENACLAYFLERLYFKRYFRESWTSVNEGYIEAMKAVEYCARILAGLYDPKEAFGYPTKALGRLTKKREFGCHEYWRDNRRLLGVMARLWTVRNRTNEGRMLRKEPLTLFLPVMEAIRQTAEKIDNKVREDLSLRPPPVEPWDQDIGLGIVYFGSVLGGDFVTLIDNLASCLACKTNERQANARLILAMERLFVSLVCRYLNPLLPDDSELELPKEYADWLGNARTRLKDDADRQRIPQRKKDKESLEKDIQSILRKIRASAADRDSRLAALSTRGKGTPRQDVINRILEAHDRIVKPIRSEVDQKKKQINSIEEEIVRLDKPLPESLKTVTLLEEKGRILGDWHRRSCYLKRQTKRLATLRKYFEWPGIVDFPAFCDCIRDVVSDSNLEVADFFSRLPDFVLKLQDKPDRKIVSKEVFKKIIDFLCISGAEPRMLKFACTLQDCGENLSFLVNGIRIAAESGDLPEGAEVGEYDMVLSCDREGCFSFYLVSPHSRESQ